MWRDSSTLYAYVNINIYVVLIIILEKGNHSEYNIIQIIFKCCES